MCSFTRDSRPFCARILTRRPPSPDTACSASHGLPHCDAERNPMSSFPAIRRLALGSALTIVFALARASTAGAEGQNLLSNPDFEAPLGDHPWMPAAWDTSRGN